MFSEKKIAITIGNAGAVVTLHEKNEIKNKIFIDELRPETKEELRSFFIKNESAHVYLLLDTVDQTYKKKIYPSVRKSDLAQIIKRDMATANEPNSINNYLVLNQHKFFSSASNNRWECLFISSSTSGLVGEWMEFLLEMPTHFAGIYMLPIETFQLFKALKPIIKSHSKVANKRNDLYCFIIQNKVSGIRQIVFSDNGIVFTRVVNYDTKSSDFLEKYEQDIYSTFEYLKRLFPDLSMSELDIVNILSSDILETVKTINNIRN